MFVTRKMTCYAGQTNMFARMQLKIIWKNKSYRTTCKGTHSYKWRMAKSTWKASQSINSNEDPHVVIQDNITLDLENHQSSWCPIAVVWTISVVTQLSQGIRISHILIKIRFTIYFSTKNFKDTFSGSKMLIVAESTCSIFAVAIKNVPCLCCFTIG